MKNGPYELVVAPENYPGKRYRDRYCYEHTLVWWQTTGQVPTSAEVIHHKNGRQRDNRFTNLELKTRVGHSLEHAQEVDVRETIVCPSCNESFEITPSDLRRRRAANKRSGAVCCSRSCTRKLLRQRSDEHGYPRYRRGCRCDVCRAANSERLRRYRRKQ